MRTRLLIALLGCSALTACDSLTGHTDTVAKAGGQELTVTRLAALFGNAKINVEATKENAEILANIWADYHRVAYAGAHGDSLADKVDAAITPLLNSERVMIYQDSMRKTMKVDSASEAGYAAGAGGLLAARHILLKFPEPATDGQKDSVRKAATALQAQVTNANFAEMAKKHPGDPGSAANGGKLPVFPKGQMVPEFSNGTAALKPGEISKPVESTFGMHIIQRLTYADVKDEYTATFKQNSLRLADSSWREEVAKEFNVAVKPGAGALVKEAVKAPSEHRKDRATLATFKGGEMSTSRFLEWMQSIPPQYQIAQQLTQAADSLVDTFVKGMAIQEVFLKKAIDAKIDVPDKEKESYHTQFKQLFAQTQTQLGVSPQQLADSAKTTSEKEALAAKRVDAVIDRFMANEGQPVTVPPPIKTVLDAKYEVTINATALAKVVEEAKKARASADSAMGRQMAPSQVPIPAPGGPPGTPPGATKKPGG